MLRHDDHERRASEPCDVTCTMINDLVTNGWVQNNGLQLARLGAGFAWHGSDGTNYRYRSLSGCTKQGAMTKVETARNTYTTVKWVCDKNQPIINARAVRSTPRVELNKKTK